MSSVHQRGIARDVIVVAASAGGLTPLRALLGSLAPGLPAGVAIVFHRNSFADGQLLPVLQRSSRLPVHEPHEGEAFLHGSIYLAPRDRHLCFAHGAFHLSRGPRLHAARPAADVLFTSAAEEFGTRVLGVVLSGAGFDGAQGCVAIKANGGLVIAQALDEASFPFMPKHAIRQDHVDAILTLPAIERAIIELAVGKTSASSALSAASTR
jgi:two-component system chemotaxis response regulator CheB